jgi:ectoine hydroxylase-related dioxygenase (phytanoyl-CoA dioxygenase family)
MLLALGQTYLGLHAGEATEASTVVQLTITAGTFRQAENQYLSLDRAQLRELPRAVQELAGWQYAQPNMGEVEWKHPLNTLGHDISEKDSDAFFDQDQTTHYLDVSVV